MSKSLAAAGKALSASLTCTTSGGDISINVSTDNAQVVRDVCIAAVTLGALYAGYKLISKKIEAAVNKGLGGDRDDQEIRGIRPGCLHVLLHCFTDERFLEVVADYESGRMKERLEHEFTQVGIKVEGLKVEIENIEEVDKRKEAINKRSVMASSSISTSISNEQKRWVVVGVCLTKVLTPALRNVLGIEMPKWHQVLCQSPTQIDEQVFGSHKKLLTPSTLHLNYKNINNNNVHKSPRAYNYQVKDPLSLAKLFVQPFMSKFTGFDETMDLSAVLAVICQAAPFTAAATHARIVRSDVRNEWAHCNFASWSEAKFLASIQSMETLVKNVNLSTEDEQRICDALNHWKNEGLQLCVDHPVDTEVLISFRDKVDNLSASVHTWVFEEKQKSSVISHLDGIHFHLNQAIMEL